MAWVQPDQASRVIAAALAKASVILAMGGDLRTELTAVEKNRIKLVGGML